ncbi:LacI family DNA-binding transcriptional regulator [Xanthomonas campestris pv. raphani]|uniref:LacI family DNA-binding transcriptional regulator n=1 Tax=Xanthomonas campestris TaxID=339 RepID=UPI00388ECF27
MTIKGKATSLDIAYLAGVSQPTVSRALRGSPMVNEDTRQRILRIARELNYKVDKNASSLRLRNAGTLALLFFEDPTADDSLINPFFHSMLGSITRACALQGYDLLVSFQQLSKDWQADYEDSNKADGIILLGYGDYQESRQRLQLLVEQGTHFVRWGAALPGQPGISIGSDNYQGGLDITEHLLAQGCRRIAFLGHASNHYPEFEERYRGHVAALALQHVVADAALQFDAITTELSGYTACLSLLDSGQAFDAVCAASDLIAIGAMRALRERGLRVPQDVAVSGFDDIALAASVAPALSTVQQDTKQAGALLVESLVALIRGDAAQSRTIPVRLAVRESSTSSGLQPPLGWNPSTAAESSDGLRGKAASGNATR